MLLVTGATGANGSAITKLLAAQGTPFRAMVRDASRSGGLTGIAGVEIVEGDFDNAASLAHSLSGVTTAFLLTPSTERAEEQQCRFVEAAQAAGVRRLVKLSQLHAAAASPVRFLRYHAAVEEAVRRSGMAWTFLRPNLFMQGLLMFAGTIRETGVLTAPAGDCRISVVDVRDNAAAAVAALTEDGHEGCIYDLTGPDALTHAEMAEKLAKTTGRSIRFVDASEGEMLEALKASGVPAWQAEGLIEDYAHYRRGEAQSVQEGVRDATGVAPRPFDVFASDHVDDFR